MTINLVEDHNIYLCEGGPVYNGGVQPITYLTQWKIVGNSEVHTLPYPDGVVLPTGYKRCEYLTFDGASYLNIGKVFDTTSICNTKFATETKNTILIGGRKPSKYTKYNFGIGLFGGNNDDRTLLAHYTAGSYINTGKLWNGEPHNIILQHGTAAIDNNSVNIIGNDISVEKLDIYIGTWSDDGTPDSRYFVGDIYDTVISDGTTETWHGIPCLDANNVPCFYDIVSQTAFYNQGSGSFTYKLYPQSTEIWSCGEYNATDGKYHILVQPLGGSIADIALDEPLRKVNDVADTIEFPSSTEGKALVTRNLDSADLGSFDWRTRSTTETDKNRYSTSTNLEVLPNCIGSATKLSQAATALCSKYNIVSPSSSYYKVEGIGVFDSSNVADGQIFIYDLNANTLTPSDFKNYVQGIELIYQITPTTELVDAPQIQEADSYSMVISQGGKAVSWSSFETNSE